MSLRDLLLAGAVIFAVAFGGALAASLVAGTLWPHIHWPAFEAIATALGAAATAAAVTVALWPIVRDHWRERDLAQSLRLQLYAHLLVLRRSMGLRTDPGHREAPGTFVTETQVPYDVLSALLPQFAVLDDDESGFVHVVYVNLVALRSLGVVDQETARYQLELIDRALKCLDRKPLLRQPIKLPWE